MCGSTQGLNKLAIATRLSNRGGVAEEFPYNGGSVFGDEGSLFEFDGAVWFPGWLVLDTGVELEATLLLDPELDVCWLPCVHCACPLELELETEFDCCDPCDGLGRSLSLPRCWPSCSAVKLLTRNSMIVSFILWLRVTLLSLLKP